MSPSDDDTSRPASGSQTNDFQQHRTQRSRTGEGRPKEARADALVVARDSDPPVTTEECEQLAAATGYRIVTTKTQRGHPDSGTYLGRGALETLAETVAELDVSAVIVDDRLTPGQHHGIWDVLPEDVRLLDRYRLVLEIFETGASTRRASLQVEFARLTYELPRLVAATDAGRLNRFTESGTRVYDVRDRIDHLERQLKELPDPGERFRERRREQGFDLVTIAGYTNAGKSTLLHRLADDLTLEDAAESGSTPNDRSNKDGTATVADGLFETLETTTRRATIDGRPILLTDTVGYVDELPHDVIASFSSTLSEAASADVVILLIDGSDPLEAIERRVAVSLEVLDEQGVDRDRLVPALNKVDAINGSEQRERIALVRRLLDEPIALSVRTGRNMNALRRAVASRLPTESIALEMPLGDDAMSLISQAYDRTSVEDVTYRDSTVVLECRGRPEVLEQLRSSAPSYPKD
ncbi:GTPase HflX [Halobacteria archaeon AArc-curdl1]|uniref:GTPase HflX n=1 Tax=Natronosalvus hydrolyticus TaxID=2979988 RepID=A0AAP2Z7V8_9EURY|nr:GTPase HflX [Halobacteria archaeon AArc-curdl1]